MKKESHEANFVDRDTSILPFRKNEFSTGIPRNIIGYCWPWTVRPNESLNFMISTYGEQVDEPYKADLVRIVCADINNTGSLKEIEVQAPFAGQYAGRHQATYPGSYVEVPECEALNQTASFTIQAFVWPSLLPVAGEGVLKPQTLVSRFNNDNQAGWSLFINGAGRLTFKVGDGQGVVHSVGLSEPLLQDRWFRVVGQYDAEHGELIVSAETASCSTIKNSSWKAESGNYLLPKNYCVSQSGPLRFGAASAKADNRDQLVPVDVLNGKLDGVRLSGAVLSADDITLLEAPLVPANMASDVIGYWDFSKGIGSTLVHDLSGNQLHGAAVNLPDRAVSGVRWDRNKGSDWRYARENFSGCHFHDDDLYDAQWQSDFSYKVPKDLESGVYAVRLRHGKFDDHIPFFVAPVKNQPTSKAAMLMPTASYTAYTNFNSGYESYRNREVTDANGRVEQVKEALFPYVTFNKEHGDFVMEHPELGKGTYRYHTDGSQCRHSSQKHPNTMVQLKCGYSKLAADLYITELLHAAEMNVDIITDDLLHQEGVSLLNDYTVVMTGHHPEYWTHAMADAIEQYMDTGGRWMYLGGNGYCWVTAYHNELPGALEVRRPVGFYAKEYWGCREMVNEFDGCDGGLLWQANRPFNSIVGIGFDGNLHCKGVPYYRQEQASDSRAAFIFDGVHGEVIGDGGLYPGGAAGFEVDAYRPEWGSPAHALVLATSGTFEYPFLMPDGTASKEYQNNYRMPRADMVFFETESGGAVFSVGSMAWTSSLNHNEFDNSVAKITLNVLKGFIDTPLFEMPKNLEGDKP